MVDSFLKPQLPVYLHLKSTTTRSLGKNVKYIGKTFLRVEAVMVNEILYQNQVVTLLLEESANLTVFSYIVTIALECDYGFQQYGWFFA